MREEKCRTIARRGMWNNCKNRNVDESGADSKRERERENVTMKKMEKAEVERKRVAMKKAYIYFNIL